ncbi:MAG: MlaD family protein [Gordonia sp. (in: high G+C Gram-positive bacteria)]|uniref:MlaD family protein n=1 Tax=Gordonia sp. (in: high G+C Gram-positive bacteria) TaxID=84139 RepID=UPI003BB5C7B5
MTFGAIALAVVAIVAAACLLVARGSDDRATGGYCAELPDAVGLYVGNPVSQMGFQVGRVTSVETSERGARVGFELDGGRSYPADVEVVSRSKSLLADRSLELVGNYRGGAELVVDQCIPPDRSYTPASISEIAGSAADFIDSLVADGTVNVRQSISGLDQALQGIGGSANAMFTSAAGAARNPDRVVADIGSSIMNMAPLTDEALRSWGEIGSIVDQLPEVARSTAVLTPRVAKFDRGVGWLVAVLYDIQSNYGDLIWPMVHGPVTEMIRLGAARAPDLQKLYGTVPSIAAALRQQAQHSGGLSMPYKAPEITGLGDDLNLIDLILRKAAK